ncbi:unnamed protein product [Penicillium olsonii]|uniref:Uncharacterized protein n=1 Tax=Penicillium olsonii TaxID=99116 RepID=A0A9W4HBH8_PENOL|nr:unnamed protein product [Penicillium olsonii]CAG7975517.1 unnamed protein product [Penicillium olsonii]
MTKNNLAVHLKWLKTQGKPTYPQLAQSSPRRDNHAPQHPPVEPVSTLHDIPEDVENETDEEMARLLFAPQSASKPRMLSRPDVVPAGTPSTLRKQSASTQSSVIRASSSKPTKPKSTPLRTDKPKPPAYDDIESIDLTGGLDRSLLSSGSIQAGGPRGPWPDQSTPCEAIKEKRGKKRKSDEYTSDLLSPSKHATKVRTLPGASRALVMENKASNELATPHQTSQMNAQSVMKRPGHSPYAHGSDRKQVIADSDDDESIFDDWIDNDDQDNVMLDVEESLYPILPEMSPASDEKTENKPDTKPPRIESFTPKAPLPSAQPSTQIKGRVDAQDSIPSTPWSKPSGSQEKDPAVMEFLGLGNKAFGHSIAKLRATLEKNAEIVYQQAMEGQPVPELIAANKNLVSQIEAVNLLQKQQKAHVDCLSRKQKLKQNLMRVISQGLDPTSMPELAQSRAVEMELEQIEQNISKLLCKVNILELAHDCPAESRPIERTEPTVSKNPFTRETIPASSSRTNIKTEKDHSQRSAFISPPKTKQPSQWNGSANHVARNMGSPQLNSMDIDDRELQWC